MSKQSTRHRNSQIHSFSYLIHNNLLRVLQIVGPFSFKVESGIEIDLRNGANPVTVDKTVFAIEYALQVLLSAKAVVSYSPKQNEFMVELRFFET